MYTGNDWDPIFSKYNKLEDILTKLDNEYSKNTVFPIRDDLFNAFKLTSYNDVKVCIIGQDPYHNYDEAMGLAFSVPEGVKIPPSLRNIYKELLDDLNILNTHGDLTSWAKQGILLINNVLSVIHNKPGSHKLIGWAGFTDYIIDVLNKKEEPIVFVLWGSFAISKKKLITNTNHYIIESVHPSPLSAYRGFFGHKPFSKINSFLKENYNIEIDFSVK